MSIKDEPSDVSEKDERRLRSALMSMSMQMLYSLADQYNVEIPFDAPDTFSIVDGFLAELDLEAKKEILSKFGDAGKVSTFVFYTKEVTPTINEVYTKARLLLELKPESQVWEKHPYFDDVEIDAITNSLRIRFHYLLGSFTYFDEATGKPNIFRHFWKGVVVYRPKSKFLEVRVRHRSIARTLSARVPAYLGLNPFYAVDLIDENANRKFIEWISSLNSATIQLPISEVSGSLVITARKGIDLRTAKRYNEELKYGRLRHGHVTIKNGEEKINFHIHFKNCHVIYTLLTSEKDIDYVINALDKIYEGIEFDRSEKLLTDFFK